MWVLVQAPSSHLSTSLLLSLKYLSSLLHHTFIRLPSSIMCRNCEELGPGCTTTASLTWAIPVNIAELGGSLEAYIRFKPCITALRLCNRYGQGPNVTVPKLPQELIDHIIGYIIFPTRAECTDEWEKRQRCSEYRCSPRDDFDMDELKEIWEEAVERVDE